MRFLIFFPLFFFAVGSAAAEVSSLGLALEVSTDKTIYKQGEEAVLTLRFQNRSQRPLILCKAVRPTYNLKLEVTKMTIDGEKRLVGEEPAAYNFLLKKEDYATIPPQGMFELKLSLRDFFESVYSDTFMAGKYQIRVEYSNWFDHYLENGKELTTDAWKGRLKSNATTITFGSGF